MLKKIVLILLSVAYLFSAELGMDWRNDINDAKEAAIKQKNLSFFFCIREVVFIVLR